MSETNGHSVPAKAPFKFDLGRLGIFVAIPVILWAFYTTSSGMIDIMSQDDHDRAGAIGAVVGSAAVLAVLALTSWSLGTDLGALLTRRRSERPAPLKVIVVSVFFLFVFSFSVFFSFTYYYKNIFALSSKKLIEELQPAEFATMIITATEKKIDSAYSDVSVHIKDEKGAAGPWLRGINELVKVAGTGGANLRDAVRKLQEENQREAEANAKKRSELTTALQTANRKLADATNELVGYDNAIANVTKIIEPKREEIKTLQAELKETEQKAADAEKGLDNLGEGCGKNCKALLSKASAARGKIAVIRSSLVQPEKEYTEQVSRRERLASQIPVLSQQVQRTQSALDSIPAAQKADIPSDVGGTARMLIDARDEFLRMPTWQTLRAIKPACDVMLASVRQAKMEADLASNFNCELQATDIRQMLTARDGVTEGRAAFAKRCGLSEGSELQLAIRKLTQSIQKDDAKGGEQSLDKTGVLLEPCIFMAKAAGISDTDVQELQKQQRTFQLSNTTRRNKFQLAREAFWSGTPDATMAIGIAVAQDAFILILKLLAEIFGYEAKPRIRSRLNAPIDVADRETDVAEVRALKSLLRDSRATRGDVSKFSVAAASSLPLEVKENLVAHLNRMIRDGTAHVDGEDSYLIDNSALKQMEEHVGMQAGSLASGSTTAKATVSEDYDDRSEAKDGAGSQKRSTGFDQYFRLKAKSDGTPPNPGKAPHAREAGTEEPLTFDQLRARTRLGR